jgi:hypothetical protein
VKLPAANRGVFHLAPACLSALEAVFLVVPNTIVTHLAPGDATSNGTTTIRNALGVVWRVKGEAEWATSRFVRAAKLNGEPSRIGRQAGTTDARAHGRQRRVAAARPTASHRRKPLLAD